MHPYQMLHRQPVRIDVLRTPKTPKVKNPSDVVLNYITVPTPEILLGRKALYAELLAHKNLIQEIVDLIYGKLDPKHQVHEPFTITKTGPKLYSVYKGNRKIAIIPEQKWHVSVTRSKITDTHTLINYSGHMAYYNILNTKNVLLSNFKSAVMEQVYVGK